MSYKTREDLQKRVQEHYDWAVSRGYEVVGVFLQGSWNYSFDLCDEQSDVDTKCWVLPKLEDIALNKKPLSFTYVMENGEHCDVKDLRLYMDCFRKQNVNFIEVLFTDFYVINPKYKNVIDLLLYNRESIAHYDKKATLNCMLGMAIQKQKDLCHTYNGNQENIIKYGYDGKQLSHVLRMNYMLQAYVLNISYEKCLNVSNFAKVLLDIKRYKKVFTKDEAIELMNCTVEGMKNTVNHYLSTKDYNHKNKEVDKLFEYVSIECLDKSLRKMF